MNAKEENKKREESKSLLNNLEADKLKDGDKIKGGGSKGADYGFSKGSGA